MLIVYDLVTKELVSVSGIKGNVTQTEINALQVVDLPETQSEYRIYDHDIINQVWQALDAKDSIELVFNGEAPVGIQIIDLPEPEPEI